jgi:cell cycle checkpoint protein
MTNPILDDLLKNNFEQYPVVWGKGRFHSHSAHHLGSLALLNASDDQLKDIYENILCRYTGECEPSPHEITWENWWNSLGDFRFCSAYRDFFNKELPTQGDWKKRFFELLLNSTNGSSLIDACLCGILHPIIHIGYAIELNSRSVACEALTMSAVCSDWLHQTASKLKPPTNGTKKALQIIKAIRVDDRTSTFNKPLHPNSMVVHESLLISYYNEWQMPDDIDKAIEELFDMSVYLYGATHKPNQIDFDFFFLHLITAMSGIGKVRSYLDENVVKKILCTFFYLSIAIYISRQQPEINEQLIDDYKVEENKRNWKYVVDQTLHTRLATDAHLVKVIRALKDAENDYGTKGGLYLTTAVKTVDSLNVNSAWNEPMSVEPWLGGPNENRVLNVRQ